MSRLRGPKSIKPSGPSAWAILNERVFGDNDIGGQHVLPKSEGLPLSWPDIFGRDAPMVMEIGFNRGRFLRGLAEKFPERNLVGIEIQRRFVWRLANQLGRDGGPKNIRVLWADAKAVSRALFPEPMFSDIYITFPDPWWKRRHVKRRLVDTDFATELNRVLRPGGVIWVKSDVEAIANEIAEALEAVEHLSIRSSFSVDALPLTHREGKCIKQGMPIYRYKFHSIMT